MSARAPVTLCLDIGGTGIKGLLANVQGRATSERVRIETPNPATPAAVLAVIRQIAAQLPRFDRVAAGFPGVVQDGVVRTAPNLDPSWTGFALERGLEKLTGHPARIANDAGVQGLAVISGQGAELVVTLGTGMGFALFVDGQYVPNIEMAHHPFRGKKTYEDLLGDRARKRLGSKRWNRHVEEAIDVLERVFNVRRIYLGGGNSERLKLELPRNVRVVPNLAGLLGGVRLWDPSLIGKARRS